MRIWLAVNTPGECFFMAGFRRGFKFVFVESTKTERWQSTFATLRPEDFGLSTMATLRGRKYLPGADKPTFPKYLQNPTGDFPYGLKAVSKPRKSLKDWSQICREYIQDLLPKYRAMLFRDLPLNSVEDIQNFVVETGFTGMEYVGGSAYRQKVQQDLFSASDEPPEISMDLHNEMSYLESYPRKVGPACRSKP